MSTLNISFYYLQFYSILPERNIIPGTAAGTVRRSVITVASAICSTEYFFEQF
jgi:hypothetical protein